MPKPDFARHCVTDQPTIPGWRAATVARLLRGKPQTQGEALDELDKAELERAAEQFAAARKLPWSGVRIVKALLKRANRATGLCNPSATTIAADAHCSPRTVERQLPLLRAVGLIDSDCQWQEGRGRGKPPKRTSNRYTFAKIDLGRAAEYVAATLIAPALENYARARKAAAERLAAVKALAKQPIAQHMELSQEREQQGKAALQSLLTEIRETLKPSEYVPTPGTGSRLLTALNRGTR